jgi:hypothetical protein
MVKQKLLDTCRDAIRASESAFRNAILSNQAEEFKMDQSPTSAIHSIDLRL